MTEAEARAVLMDLGCEKRPPKLSARVTGDIDDQVIIESREVPCASAAEFERLAQEGQLNGKGGQSAALVGGPLDTAFLGSVWVFSRNAGVLSQEGYKLVPLGSIPEADGCS